MREQQAWKRWAVGAVLGAVAIGLAACGGDSDDQASPPSTSAADATPATSYQSLVEARHQGDVSPTQLALTEFQLQFGAVPGSLDLVADGSQPYSATGALDRIVSVWDELTSEQQEAVIDRLRPLLDQVVEQGTPGPSNIRSPDAPRYSPSQSSETEIEAAARSAADYVESQLPGTLDYEMVFLDRDPDGGDLVTGITISLPESLFRFLLEEGLGIEPPPLAGDGCYTVIGPTARGLTSPALGATLAHEMFHCWSHLRSPDLATHMLHPEWFEEGIAAWVGETYVGGTAAYGAGWWEAYLSPRQFPLLRSSYEAIGFWSWIDEHGPTDLWSAIPAFHAIADRGDDRALLVAATQDVDSERLTGLAAGRFREPTWGAPWTMGGPGATGQFSENRRLPVGTTTIAAPDIGFLAADEFSVRTPEPGEVTTVTITGAGHLRARWSDGGELIGAGGSSSGRWCLATVCECPDGTSILGFDLLPDDVDGLSVAVGAIDAAGRVDIVVEDPCESPAETTEPGAADASLTGTWRATDAAVLRMFEVMLAESDLGGVAGAPSGDVLLTFDGAGMATLSYENVHIQLSSPDVTFDMGVDGGGVFEYRTDGTSMTLTSIEFSLSFEAAGAGPITFTQDDLGLGEPTDAVWGIEGTRLTLQTASSATRIPNMWARHG